MKDIIAMQFREMAGEFRRRAADVRNGKPLAANAGEYCTDWSLCERGGLAIIGAFDAGLLTLPGLPDAMRWYRAKAGALAGWRDDMARIPRSILNIVTATTHFDNRPRGLLAAAMPALFPPAPHAAAIAVSGYDKEGSLARELGAIQQEEIARSFDLLAVMVMQAAPPANELAPATAPAGDGITIADFHRITGIDKGKLSKAAKAGKIQCCRNAAGKVETLDRKSADAFAAHDAKRQAARDSEPEADEAVQRKFRAAALTTKMNSATKVQRRCT